MLLRFWLSSVLSFFFFKQKTAYEMRISDWSSDVCSSDLLGAAQAGGGGEIIVAPRPRLRLIAELVIGRGERRARVLVIWLGQDQLVQKLGRPAIIPGCNRRLARREQLVGAARQRDIAGGPLFGRPRVDIGRVTVPPPAIAMLGRIHVVK